MTQAPSMILSQGSIGLGSIAALSLLYLLVLYSVGRLGRRITGGHKLAPWVFSFALAIYCTSWAFYGVTAQAAVNGWWIPPTYIGSLLLFWFGFGLIARIAIACRRYKITSVADFIATRYGHSRLLAVLTTLIVLTAVIPYIALQLQAVSTSINALVQRPAHPHWYQDTGLYVSLWLAVFAMLFIGRSAKAHQPNPGLMTAIAFESLVKLIALLAVGVFVCWGLYDGIGSIFSQAANHPAVQSLQQKALPTSVYWIHVLLGFVATLCLPRQFHVSFVEIQHLKHLHLARWVFPLYLLLMSLFTLPIALAGLMLLGPEANIDLVVLQLPLSANRTDMALLAYLGGFSAATSMVIVATVVLGIMISNDLLTPLLYRLQQKPVDGKPLIKMVTLRRASMLTVLTLGYLYYLLIGTETGLAQLGLMAFALIAQLAPAIILGLTSRNINRQGALAGLSSGAFIWAYILLLPELGRAGLVNWHWLQQGPFDIQWLAPSGLFGGQFDSISLGVLLSLSVNVLMLLLVSQLSTTRLSEWLQSGRFLRRGSPERSSQDVELTVQDCYLLVRRFAGEREAKQLLQRHLKTSSPDFNQKAPLNLQQGVERTLSAVVGGASMRLLLNATSKNSQLPLESVARFVDEASQVYLFNQALLRATIDNISMGISVVDADLRLIAWNQRYLEMFAYPTGFVEVGKPVAELIRYNAERGWLSRSFETGAETGAEADPQSLELEIQKRLNYLRQGSSYKFQRRQQDGRVFEMQGNPLPGGGFVTTYSDVSSFIEVQQELEHSNNTLELRVTERTAELEQLNQQLADAKQQLEEHTVSKNRFFAAASHDLLQPFNAAALFCGLIREKTQDPEIKQLSKNLAASLNSAEELLASILELTKLDSGVVRAEPRPLALQQLLEQSGREAQVLAAEKGLQFRCCVSSLTVQSDSRLLKRVIQNFISNAIRYTPQGKILLGVRRVTNQQGERFARIEVWDTGPGIAKEVQPLIFQEFQQGPQADQKGLGIGLAISQRISQLLNHPLSLSSVPGKGSCFAVTVPLAKAAEVLPAASVLPELQGNFAGKKILLLDNEPQLLAAVTELLRSWQCEVMAVATPFAAVNALQQGFQPDLLLFDYHLDQGATGVEVASQLQQHFAVQAPVVIHSADQQQQTRDDAQNAGFHFMLKPLKAASLKRLLQRLLK
ncbi:PAS domain-containing hybrid sensor histidine kinase/response regulator [Rheinheimera sp.]|uniref:PAS domain-containing hybrid sensor histidine kinase/response regulator n=1 Tax=Rheinheimera sp. TaxID=1869214 RepID=UPI002FDE91F0